MSKYLLENGVPGQQVFFETKADPKSEPTRDAEKRRVDIDLGSSQQEAERWEGA